MEDSDGIFEIRVEVGSDIFRAFSFFDKGQLIIVVNGFQKKYSRCKQLGGLRGQILKDDKYPKVKDKNTSVSGDLASHYSCIWTI